MLGIIPARGGSKRVSRKNIRDFLGKPLIAWTIETAQESKAFERLIVLTDDEEIAAVAKEYGAEIPFMEPEEFATDTAYIADALRFAFQKLSDDDAYAPTDFVLLEPSSIGRDVGHIHDTIKMLSSRNDFDSLIGISEVPPHFSHLKQLHVNNEGIVGRVGDGAPMKDLTHRNQNVAKSYYINSAVYGFRRKNLFEDDKKLWGNSTYGYVMDPTYLADIDTEDDWMLAEFKIRRKLGLL